MPFLLLIPAILSLFVLGAHFLRADLLPLVAACFILTFLLFIPRRWVMRLVQLVLALGALEWGRTVAELYNQRQGAGEPWLRMVIILVVVAAVTAASAALFETKTLRRRYAR